MTLTKLLGYVIEYIDEHTEPGFITGVSTYTLDGKPELRLVLETWSDGRRLAIARIFDPVLFSSFYGPAGDILDVTLRDMVAELQQAVKAATT